MAKITYIKIAGKNYPMSFSVGAAKKIMERYGGTNKMKEKLKEEGSEAKKLDMISDILELLISQGCAYKNYFEADLPAPENSPVIEGKWTPIPKEMLDIALGISDADEMAKSIEDCIAAGSKKDLSAKSTRKNAEATQE